jgi:hypothetical protein
LSSQDPRRLQKRPISPQLTPWRPSRVEPLPPHVSGNAGCDFFCRNRPGTPFLRNIPEGRFLDEHQGNHGNSRNVPYRRNRPPGAPTGSTHSLPTSQAMPGAIFFCRNRPGTPFLRNIPEGRFLEMVPPLPVVLNGGSGGCVIVMASTGGLHRHTRLHMFRSEPSTSSSLTLRSAFARPASSAAKGGGSSRSFVEPGSPLRVRHPGRRLLMATTKTTTMEAVDGSELCHYPPLTHSCRSRGSSCCAVTVSPSSPP